MFKLPEEGRLRYTGKILGLHNATAHWENSEEIAAKYGHFELKKTASYNKINFQG